MNALIELFWSVVGFLLYPIAFIFIGGLIYRLISAAVADGVRKGKS